MLCKYCKKDATLARGIDKCHAAGCNNYKNMYYEFCQDCAEKSHRCECCGGELIEINKKDEQN